MESSIGLASGRGELERALDLIAEAASTAHAVAPTQSVLPRLLDLARALLQADAYALWRRDGASGAWRATATHGLSEEYCRAAPAALPPGYRIPPDVLAVPDPDRAELLAPQRAYQRAEGIQSLLVLPLTIRGDVSGSIAFYWRTPRTFNESEVRAGRALASIASVAIANAELSTEWSDARGRLERHIGQLEALYELSVRAHRAESLREIHEAAIDSLVRGLRCDRASILLFDDAGVMRFRAHRGLSDAYRKAVDGHSPWSPDAVDPEPIAVADAATDASLGPYRDTILGEGIRALAFVPLVHQGRLLGKFMLYYNAPHAFAPEELRLAQTIASQVAWGIARQSSEEALRAQKGRLEALIAAQGDLGDGILLVRDGRIVWTNDATARIVGVSAAELCEASFDPTRLLAPDELARVQARAAERERDGRTHDHYETVLRRPDGADVHVEIGLKELEPAGLRMIVLRDVSQRVRHEQELERARRELAASEKLSALGSLVNGVAHELRTPLASLANELHLIASRIQRANLRGAHVPDELRELPGLVAGASDEIDRINRLVLSLRRFTRGEADDGARIPLREAVSRASRLFEKAYRGRIHVVEKHDPRALDAPVRPEFQQVIINLLENAADASPSGGRVELVSMATEREATLLVRDQGVGVPPDVLPRVFDAFFTTKKDGTGLGLSIVKRIVEQHGGSIDVASRVNHGATFTVRIPLQPPAPAREAPARA